MALTGATVFCLIYHLANAYLLGASKKHISGIGAVITLGIPYAFGSVSASACLPILE